MTGKDYWVLFGLYFLTALLLMGFVSWQLWRIEVRVEASFKIHEAWVRECTLKGGTWADQQRRMRLEINRQTARQDGAPLE